MGKKKPKQYSAQFKFNVVVEALKAEGAEAEVKSRFVCKRARGAPWCERVQAAFVLTSLWSRRERST